MPPNPTSSALLQRSAGATRLPTAVQRDRPAGMTTLPVLRATRSSGQMTLPFFQSRSRSG